MAGGGGGGGGGTGTPRRATKGDQSASGLAWGFQSVALDGEGLTFVYPVIYEGPGPPLRPLAQVGPVACAALVRSFGSLRPVALSRGASGGVSLQDCGAVGAVQRLPQSPASRVPGVVQDDRGVLAAWAGFRLGVGGRNSPLASPPPSPQMGSIDGPPNILPRLTPGAQR